LSDTHAHKHTGGGRREGEERGERREERGGSMEDGGRRKEEGGREAEERAEWGGVAAVVVGEVEVVEVAGGAVSERPSPAKKAGGRSAPGPVGTSLGGVDAVLLVVPSVSLWCRVRSVAGSVVVGGVLTEFPPAKKAGGRSAASLLETSLGGG
jgi:hypothetical protein